jgi:hypothetical protein
MAVDSTVVTLPVRREKSVLQDIHPYAPSPSEALSDDPPSRY